MYRLNFTHWRWNTHLTSACILTALAVLAGASGCSSGTSNVQGNVIPVTMSTLDTFVPQEIAVAPGDVIQWNNVDTDPHAPTVDPGNVAAGGPASDAVYPSGVPAGGKYTWTVPMTATAGTVWFYHCRIHGTAGDGRRLGQNMVGVITVTSPAQYGVEMNALDHFSPQTAHVDPGTVIIFHNTDTDPHAPTADALNVTAGGPASDPTFPSGVPPGATYSWRVPLNTAANTTWYYHCRFRGVAGDGAHIGTGMAGVIVSN